MAAFKHEFGIGYVGTTLTGRALIVETNYQRDARHEAHDRVLKEAADAFAREHGIEHVVIGQGRVDAHRT